jgi:hypothetical protein
MVILVAVPLLASAVAHARTGAAIVREGPAAALVARRAGLGTLLVAFWVGGVAAALDIGADTAPGRPCTLGAAGIAVFLLGIGVLLVAAAVHLGAMADSVRAAARA